MLSYIISHIYDTQNKYITLHIPFCIVYFRRLAVDHENVRPDIVILGKALSGGVYPVSYKEYLCTMIIYYCGLL